MKRLKKKKILVITSKSKESLFQAIKWDVP